MKVHLVDGTYELFRQHFGNAARHENPPPFAAALGVLGSTLQLVADGATHLGVASDHVIESFRNDLWAGYKTSDGMDPVLLEQIPVMEELLSAAGFTVWPMVEWEADDATGGAHLAPGVVEVGGQRVEVAEELVRAVDQVDLHHPSLSYPQLPHRRRPRACSLRSWRAWHRRRTRANRHRRRSSCGP